MLSLIVAIAENNAIGIAGDLLCYLPNDLQYFKRQTSGCTVVMGKRTFYSLPKRPLPNRRNIVLTTDTAFTYDNTEVAHSVADVMDMIAADEQAFIIGGGVVYRQFLPLVDKLYITHIHHIWDDADTFFPEIDLAIWQCVSEEHHDADEKNPYPYTFAVYTKR
jgi:dihydrofolate reductase